MAAGRHLVKLQRHRSRPTAAGWLAGCHVHYY